jgi:hypothetical protein
MCGNKPRAMTCRAEASILPEKAAQGEVSRPRVLRSAMKQEFLLRPALSALERLYRPYLPAIVTFLGDVLIAVGLFFGQGKHQMLCFSGSGSLAPRLRLLAHFGRRTAKYNQPR